MDRGERAQRREAIRRYLKEGHSTKEAAIKYGITARYIRTFTKGIPRKIDKVIPSNKEKLKADYEVAAFIAERLPGFEYAGGYTGSDGRCNLRCKECGAVFNRSMISVRHRNIRCRECEKAEKAKQAELRKRQADAKEEAKQRAKRLRAVRLSRQVQVQFCAVCGKPIISVNPLQKYCSKGCARAVEYFLSGSKDRLCKENIVDKGITLERLYKRDGGICQLCGCSCDYSDYHRTDSGAFVAGNNYPSIDHIIPLSMGGKHSWDNVRLAHRICNVKEYQNKQRFNPLPSEKNC